MLAIRARRNAGGPIRPKRLKSGLIKYVLETRSTFADAELTLYGLVSGLQKGDDIVVALCGLAKDLRVMQQRLVLTTWINAGPVRFRDFPDNDFY